MTTKPPAQNTRNPQPTDRQSPPPVQPLEQQSRQRPEPTSDQARAQTLAQEWIDSAIPAGSSRYYAILHADTDAREYLQLVTTLISIWSQLAFNSQEPEVTMRKTDWWRAELSGEHRAHPITQLLEPYLNKDPGLANHLLDILSGYADLLQFGSPSTDEANKLFHWSTGAVACLTLTGVENTVNNPVARAGVALSRFRCLRHLPDHINARLLCLPLTSLEANGLSPKQLQPGVEDPALDTFFKQQLQSLNREMEATAAELLHAGTASRPLYIYLRSQQHLLRKIATKGARLLQPVARPSPLRNYFVAFKAARQHYRHN